MTERDPRERRPHREEGDAAGAGRGSSSGAPADVEGTGPGAAIPETTPPAAVSSSASRDRFGPDASEDRREAGAIASAAPGEVSGPAMALSFILPGAGHMFSGSWVRGAALLFPWAVLLAVVFLGWSQISALPGEGPSLDDYIAAAVLALSMAGVWFYAQRDLLRARRAQTRRLEAGDSAEERAGDSQWVIAARRFRQDKLAVAGLIIVVLLYLLAVFAPFIAPYDPTAQQDLVETSYLSPSSDYLLGTDIFGRDILTRIIYGARISLAIGFVAVAISILLGTLLGAVAGYLGGWVDTVVMRGTDMVLAFPRLVLLILIIALFEPSLVLIILVLGLTQWPGTARIVRGEVLSLREREFIQAARALGMGRARVIFRHLVPNVLAPVIVAATLGIGNTIVLEAGLSFLGLGVQPPMPSWGNMVADGRQNLIGAWWVATFPGLAIVITVLAFNLAGDGLRDALDPRLRE